MGCTPSRYKPAVKPSLVPKVCEPSKPRVSKTQRRPSTPFKLPSIPPSSSSSSTRRTAPSISSATSLRTKSISRPTSENGTLLPRPPSPRRSTTPTSRSVSRIRVTNGSRTPAPISIEIVERGSKVNTSRPSSKSEIIKPVLRLSQDKLASTGRVSRLSRSGSETSRKQPPSLASGLTSSASSATGSETGLALVSPCKRPSTQSITRRTIPRPVSGEASKSTGSVKRNDSSRPTPCTSIESLVNRTPSKIPGPTSSASSKSSGSAASRDNTPSGSTTKLSPLQSVRAESQNLTNVAKEEFDPTQDQVVSALVREVIRCAEDEETIGAATNEYVKATKDYTKGDTQEKDDSPKTDIEAEGQSSSSTEAESSTSIEVNTPYGSAEKLSPLQFIKNDSQNPTNAVIDDTQAQVVFAFVNKVIRSAQEENSRVSKDEYLQVTEESTKVDTHVKLDSPKMENEAEGQCLSSIEVTSTTSIKAKKSSSYITDMDAITAAKIQTSTELESNRSPIDAAMAKDSGSFKKNSEYQRPCSSSPVTTSTTPVEDKEQAAEHLHLESNEKPTGKEADLSKAAFITSTMPNDIHTAAKTDSLEMEHELQVTCSPSPSADFTASTDDIQQSSRSIEGDESIADASSSSRNEKEFKRTHSSTPPPASSVSLKVEERSDLPLEGDTPAIGEDINVAAKSERSAVNGEDSKLEAQEQSAMEDDTMALTGLLDESNSPANDELDIKSEGLLSSPREVDISDYEVTLGEKVAGEEVTPEKTYLEIKASPEEIERSEGLQAGNSSEAASVTFDATSEGEKAPTMQQERKLLVIFPGEAERQQEETHALVLDQVEEVDSRYGIVVHAQEKKHDAPAYDQDQQAEDARVENMVLRDEQSIIPDTLDSKQAIERKGENEEAQVLTLGHKDKAEDKHKPHAGEAGQAQHDAHAEKDYVLEQVVVDSREKLSDDQSLLVHQEGVDNQANERKSNTTQKGETEGAHITANKQEPCVDIDSSTSELQKEPYIANVDQMTERNETVKEEAHRIMNESNQVSEDRKEGLPSKFDEIDKENAEIETKSGRENCEFGIQQSDACQSTAKPNPEKKSKRNSSNASGKRDSLTKKSKEDSVGTVSSEILKKNMDKRSINRNTSEDMRKQNSNTRSSNLSKKALPNSKSQRTTGSFGHQSAVDKKASNVAKSGKSPRVSSHNVKDPGNLTKTTSKTPKATSKASAKGELHKTGHRTSSQSVNAEAKGSATASNESIQEIVGQMSPTTKWSSQEGNVASKSFMTDGDGRAGSWSSRHTVNTVTSKGPFNNVARDGSPTPKLSTQNAKASSKTVLKIESGRTSPQSSHHSVNTATSKGSQQSVAKAINSPNNIKSSQNIKLTSKTSVNTKPAKAKSQASGNSAKSVKGARNVTYYKNAKASKNPPNEEPAKRTRSQSSKHSTDNISTTKYYHEKDGNCVQSVTAVHNDRAISKSKGEPVKRRSKMSNHSIKGNKSSQKNDEHIKTSTTKAPPKNSWAAPKNPTKAEPGRTKSQPSAKSTRCPPSTSMDKVTARNTASNRSIAIGSERSPETSCKPDNLGKKVSFDERHVDLPRCNASSENVDVISQPSLSNQESKKSIHINGSCISMDSDVALTRAVFDVFQSEAKLPSPATSSLSKPATAQVTRVERQMVKSDSGILISSSKSDTSIAQSPSESPKAPVERSPTPPTTLKPARYRRSPVRVRSARRDSSSADISQDCIAY